MEEVLYGDENKDMDLTGQVISHFGFLSVEVLDEECLNIVITGAQKMVVTPIRSHLCFKTI